MNRKLTAVFFIVLTLIFVANPVLLARAGGGESYGGGGGGGGSFGGGGGDGGGGGGELILCLIWLIIKYPCIGIPLTLFLIAAAIFTKIKGTGAVTDRNLKRAQRAVRSSSIDQNLKRLVSKDPNFSLEALKTRVATAFAAVQKAWSIQDLTKITPFVSDGINERFSLQIDMQKAEGWRNIMENVSVLKVELVSVLSDQNYDTLHFAVTAKAKDYKVNLKTGKTLQGSMINDKFTEVWTFLRKADVKTLNRKGAFEGNCPNCAAPLAITDEGNCKACKAFIRSPNYDWILSEITQVEEWEPRSAEAAVPANNIISEKDPNFSTQYIEDRTSVVFYRYQAALFTGDALHLMKVASTTAYKDLATRISGNKKGDTVFYYRFPAVGKVETLWVQSEGDIDKVHVLVKWSGSGAERNLATGTIRVTGAQTIRTTVFTLFRKGDALSPSESFASAHCPNCGAPEIRDSKEVCPYCGTVLNDGSRTWILREMQDYQAWMQVNRERWNADRKKAVFSQNPSAVIEALAAMMFADGNADEQEKKKLAEFASKYGMTKSAVDELADRAVSGNHVWQIPSDKAKAQGFLLALTDMSLSDGRVSREEWKILKDVAYKTGIDEPKLKNLVRERQKALINFGKKYFKKPDENIQPPPPPDMPN